MAVSLRRLLLSTMLPLGATTAHAHCMMLIPDVPTVAPGATMVLLYQWGHAFQHEVDDAGGAPVVRIIGPDGKQANLPVTVTRVKIPTVSAGSVGGYRVSFVPKAAGTYSVIAESEPMWLEDDQGFLRSTTRAVVSVEGDLDYAWASLTGQAYGWSVRTRPFGLLPSMLFQARLFQDGKPRGDELVEIVRYNAVAPKKLPPKEFVAHFAFTDAGGGVTFAAPAAGWWGFLSQRVLPKTRLHKGKEHPVVEETSLWYHVEARVP